MSGQGSGGWWRRGQRPDQPAVTLEEIVGVRVNHDHLRVPTRGFLRVFRNGQADWCAEIVDADRNKILVFDYHPPITLLNLLKKAGASVAIELIEQGAEGDDIRHRGGSR
jgi:hypothetical protein